MDKETIKQLLADGVISQEVAEKYVPELKESEERISKEIIKYLERTVPHHHRDEVLKSKEWITWLEKQGEQKSIEFVKDDELSDLLHKVICSYVNNPFIDYEQRDEVSKKIFTYIETLEKQVKQNIEIESVESTEYFNDFVRWFVKQRTNIIPSNKEVEEWARIILNHAKKVIQGKQKLTDKVEDYNNIDPHFGKPIGKTALEAIKEEKVDNANKVEPKFKAGDWVVYKNDICQIVKREEGCNKLVTNFGIEKELVNERNLSTARLWTIEDAKEGDVLFTSSTASHETFIFKSIDESGNAECYFAYDSEDGFREGKYHFIGSATNCKPATKEQHDLLFQKMKEAGYEWNPDKKKLKKIEQKSIEPDDIIEESYQQQADDLIDMVTEKPAWSEEDEEMLNLIIARLHSHSNVEAEEYGKDYRWFKSLKDRVRPQLKQEWSEEDEVNLSEALHHIRMYNLANKADRLDKWLKSLKERYIWKPSDEQMEVLLSEVTGWTKGCPKQKILESLYNDLKKLKEL